MEGRSSSVKSISSDSKYITIRLKLIECNQYHRNIIKCEKLSKSLDIVCHIHLFRLTIETHSTIQFDGCSSNIFIWNCIKGYSPMIRMIRMTVKMRCWVLYTIHLQLKKLASDRWHRFTYAKVRTTCWKNYFMSFQILSFGSQSAIDERSTFE